MSTTTEQCCGDGASVNPTKSYVRKKRSRSVQVFDLKNPIPDEVNDPSDIKKVFKEYRFVPFAGTCDDSGDSLLLWYLMLAKLSPTHAACIAKKVKYAIGGKAALVRATDPEWQSGEEVQPLSAAEQTNAQTELKQLVEFTGGVREFNRRLAWNYEATGNAFFELSYSEVNGVGRATMRAHKVTHCKYMLTKPGEARVIAVSPVWTKEYLEKNPPRLVPLYPLFSKDSDGVFRAMFHLKAGDNEWYGRPESQGADLYKYREVQDAIYQIKQAAGNFTGQVIIEVEDDDPAANPALDDQAAQDAGFLSFADRFEQNFTQKSDNPQSVVVTSRPYGSRPMFVYQVEPNTNESWYKETGEIAGQHILRNHGCTLRFMGYEVAAGFSTDVYISDYVLHMEPVINELRSRILNFTNGGLTAAWLELFNRPEMNQYSLAFTSPIQSTIEKFQNAQTQPQQNQPNNTPQV